jgi:ABC-type cobalamin transport system ATPase subunit
MPRGEQLQTHRLGRNASTTARNPVWEGSPAFWGPAWQSKLAGRLNFIGGVELARALIGSPRLLLLDEPSMGLAPQAVTRFFGMLADIRRTQGVTVLMVEQNVYQAAQRCDYLYVLEGGRNRMEGPPTDVMADERLRHAYLGRRGQTGMPGPGALQGG